MDKKIKTIAHLADIHIRKLHRFVEYRDVFDRLYKKLTGTFPAHEMPLPYQINQINTILKKNESQNHYTVIDLHDIFLDGRELLSRKYTSDGVHLNEEGYHKWSNFIKNYISSNFF